MRYFIGIDIGGTKSAATLSCDDGAGALEILEKKVLPTMGPRETLNELFKMTGGMLASAEGGAKRPSAIGISCGGPLDARKGVIISPPNLPGWNNIDIVRAFEERYNMPAFLQNDANACAVAEWKYGAGRGAENMVFMTFGTGLGAGIIANSKLVYGANGNAGEVGHIRLEKFGPVGYGKMGSFEGFCSGSGIAQAARAKALELLQSGGKCAYCADMSGLEKITAKSVAQAAESGDESAISVYREAGEYLGRGVAILIDILNPELVVIGSIFARSEGLLRDSMEKTIVSEALNLSASACRVVPAELGEKIGDYAAAAVASCGLEDRISPC